MIRSGKYSDIFLLFFLMSLAAETLAASRLDQQNDVGNTAACAVSVGTSHYQSVTAGLGGAISSIEVFVEKRPNASADLIVGIYEMRGGGVGPLIAQTTAKARIVPQVGWLAVTFDTKKTGMAAGTKFIVGLSSSGSNDHDERYLWYISDDYYNRGDALPGCIGRPGDFQFRTYVDTAVPAPPPAKLIVVGICGVGAIISEPCAGGYGWYDPQYESIFSPFDPLNDSDLAIVASAFSGLDAIALRVAKTHPTAITAIKGFSLTAFLSNVAKARTVAEFVKTVYGVRDRVYLIGHSGGAAVVQEAAYSLAKLGIPVEMTAQIDSLGTGPDAKVSSNVRRAFNFYYPRNFALDSCFVYGETNIEPSLRKNPTGTIVSNTSIDNPPPIGPDGNGTYCAGHKNMDNDPRVWRPILEFVLQ